ncbi:MAG: 4Fe-4S binding protein [Chromatiales bacterium]|nr:4Fe-4S binding protein [Chromatiales bacterium]
MNRTQKLRLVTRGGFFLLFILAPPLDLFRYDLTQGHFIILGQAWTLGIESDPQAQLSMNVLLRGLLPVLAFVALALWIAWRYGRLYCGWLCPHFSVVQIINGLMRRACGRLSLWDNTALPEAQADGTRITPSSAWWLMVIPAVIGFALLWAVSLLTYLLPPLEIWHNLVHATLTRNQTSFIAVGTALFIIEFTFARHLFCRYGCAVGLFQSLAWMGNRKALVVKFDHRHARACASCDASCEHACPMRLKPRGSKRRMWSCTQCQLCVQACENVNASHDPPSVLVMASGPDALERPLAHAGKHGQAADPAGSHNRY